MSSLAHADAGAGAVSATALVLAFDTSTERLAAGVLRLCGGPAGPVAGTPAAGRGGAAVDAGIWTEDAAGGAAASAALLPTLQRLLGRAGARLAEVDAVAFGRGPGAFTGLRTSCAVAQGLAFALGRPVLPIDSLLIVAEQARHTLGPGAAGLEIGVAMDARMGEIYAARYCWHEGGAQDRRPQEGRPQGGSSPDGGWPDGGWQERQAPALWAPAALAAAWAEAPPALCTGSAWPLHAAQLRAACPQLRFVDAGPDRAAALLALAASAWRYGVGVDATQALPLYLRDKVALTTAERAVQRAQGPAVAPGTP